MKPEILKQPFLELLELSIEEPLEKGHRELTNRLVSIPILVVTTENSPLMFTFGWDPEEKFNVLSLN